MVIEGNGISIQVDQYDNQLTFHVVEQSKEATEALQLLKVVHDHKTGFQLRSNIRPSFSKENKRFYIRGNDTSKNRSKVKVIFDSTKEAEKAVEALQRLVGKVKKPDVVKPLHSNEAITYQKGGTSHVRFAFINSEMADELCLTGHKFYPKKTIDWEKTNPIHTVNDHYNEHIGQAVDVLNKTLEKPVEVDSVVNPHKVTPKQAKKAYEILYGAFQEAWKSGCLIAFWRLATGIRGPDFKD